MSELTELNETIDVVESSESENIDVSEQANESDQEPEVDPLKILGIPTERKPEHFEPEAEINENLPDFDPPDPNATPVEELPDLSAKKTSSKITVDAGAESAASMAIEVVDVIVPLAIDHFISKDGNPEQFKCSSSDQKSKAKKATAKYLGDMNVEVSPLWEMVFAVSLMYVEPIMTALQMSKLKRENQEQKQQLEESEKQRIEEKRQRIEAERLLNEKDLENAEIARKATESKLEAKRLQEELEKAEKPKTTRKPRTSRAQTTRKPTQRKK